MVNMQVTYESLDRAATQLRSGQEELEVTLNRLRTVVTELVMSGFTTTRASGAFDRASEEFTQGVKQTISGLEAMAQFLTVASQTLNQTDEHLARTIERAA